MGFDLCNYSMKIRESTKTPTPKMEAHLGMWGSFLHTLTFLGAWNVILALHSWPTPSQAFALVISPKLGLQQIEAISGDYVDENIKRYGYSFLKLSISWLIGWTTFSWMCETCVLFLALIFLSCYSFLPFKNGWILPPLKLVTSLCCFVIFI